MKKYDLVIIGAGSGGLTVAEYASQLGASVALIEKADSLGGDRLNGGCVPSKALIHAAKTFYRAGHGAEFGVNAYPELDFEQLKASIEAARNRIRTYRDNDKYYQQLGVDIYHEHARFISTSKLRAGAHEIVGKHFIIATGSKPRIPAIPGLAKADYYTNETIFDISALPRRMAVIGGGVIGCEIASAFNQIGSEVTIYEKYDHLSLRVDKPIAEFVAGRFVKRNMKVRTHSAITEIKNTKRGTKIDFTINGEPQHQFVDAIFIASGRLPSLDIGLENAGVKFNDRAIEIDKFGRTSNKRIWAIGDVTATAGFTHVAAEQGFYATLHALFGSRHEVKLHILPYVIYTSPEVAHVGKTSKQLQDEGIEHTVRTLDYTQIDRAMIENKGGLIQVSLNKNDQLLGATMVGSHASEQIGQYVVAMNHDLRMSDFASAILPYPTYAMATKQIAAEYLLEKTFKSNLTKKAVNAARMIRR